MSLNRYCKNCKQEHGPLYVCPSYDQKLAEEITKAAEVFRKNLLDPNWIKTQKLEPHEVVIFKMFAGIKK